MKNFLGRVLSTIVGNIATFSIFGLLLFALIIISSISSVKPSVKKGSVLELTFEEPILESSMDQEVSVFSISTPSTFYLDNILKAIENAKTDDNIKGISLKVENFKGGLTQASEVRKALEDFKTSGKFVYSYSNNSTQLSYYINSVADSVFQNPLGGVLLQGMSSEVMFFKNAGDKYGVDFQVIRYGEFKSAVEPYFRTDLSEENKLQLNVMLGDIWNNISKDIAKSRKITDNNFQTITDSLYSYIPEVGKKHRIFDQIIQESEYDDFIFKKLNLETNKSKINSEILAKYTIGVEDYYNTLNSNDNSNKIAVLYASGTITEGDGFDGIQSKTYVKAIREIEKNKNIKALVLRVNSPGGSANASEEILFELSRLKKTMPIVVSFGDVAASGGYYIAQDSDKIFAQPNTITGSIGVFGMIPNAKELVNSFGVTTDVVKTNANADQLKSIFNPLSDDATRLMQKSVVLVYEKFVNHVAKNRKMTFDQVNKIGGGRVWSGTSAKEIGLIDEFGGLNNALAEAAKLAKIESYSTESFPKRKDSFEELMEKIQGNNIKARIQSELGTDAAKIFQELKIMNEQKGIQARMPFEVKIY
ncbi:signal peptide peptidase SppA [Faecalibacter rhinopitheci]|uniref:Signal peptide peptidase SppA n=1 Tax=Faecalibacter rhinopitheci TaxID=2779678 RepID=A0A8J7G5J1_9FLAO|nr:signal peptide peptidase SppA [Faecalibacter rhinopitheci]MBF0596510.1 signal peptide peptidase SppA [Faecalibacter rhinopitheci]